MHLVRILVEAGAKLEFKDRWGADALTEAVKHDRSAVVEFLVAQGASTETKDGLGLTALDYAQRPSRDKQIIDALIMKGV